VSKVAMGGRKT